MRRASSARMDYASAPPQSLSSSSRFSYLQGHDYREILPRGKNVWYALLMYPSRPRPCRSPFVITYGVESHLHKIAHAVQTGCSKRIDQKCRACVLHEELFKKIYHALAVEHEAYPQLMWPSSLVFSSKVDTLLYANTTHRKDW